MADPLNLFAKELKAISSKRVKTEADFAAMALIEWKAGLYLNEEQRLVLPSEVLEASFQNGAKKRKLGKQAQAGLFCYDHAVLKFDGDNLGVKELWERGKNRWTVGVRVGTAKVMRTRPRIDRWEAEFEMCFDDGLFNRAQVEEIAVIAGAQVGIGDWRPKFGRFNVEFAG
jgi:hypothetical protein